MRRIVLPTAAALLIAATGGVRAVAQAPREVLQRGLAAYRGIDYDSAAALFRQALAATGPAALPDSARATCYVYLGATEIFRGRGDGAKAAFLGALAADPRHRPDALIFPPEVTSAFDSVRRGSALVRIRAARDTTIPAGERGYAVRIYASAPHRVVIDLAFENGQIARSLHAGSIADSMDFHWAPANPGDPEPLEGRLILRVTSHSGTGRQRSVSLPLTVQVTRSDPLPLPPRPVDSSAVARTTTIERSATGLTIGVLTGAAAIALPAMVSADEGATGRYYIGGALALAGLYTFIVGRPVVATPRVAADTSALDAWRREVDRVTAENVRRRREFSVRITAGRETLSEGRMP
jgi:hypothetical protein